MHKSKYTSSNNTNKINYSKIVTSPHQKSLKIYCKLAPTIKKNANTYSDEQCKLLTHNITKELIKLIKHEIMHYDCTIKYS